MVSKFSKELLEELSKTNSQSEIASIIGTSREYVSKLMRGYGITAGVALRNNLIEITTEMHEIIVGCLLGDGCIRKSEDKSLQHRLQVFHSEEQKEYINWIHNKLKTICKSKAPKKNDKGYYYFVTISHKELTKLKQEFYPCGKKCIPENFIEYISPLMLAVWFMDDGSRCNKNCGQLHTECFTIEENQKIANAINSKYNLNVKQTIRNNGYGKYPYIYIPSESFKIFREIIRPYIIPTMMYKLEDTLATTVYEDSRTE